MQLIQLSFAGIFLVLFSITLVSGFTEDNHPCFRPCSSDPNSRMTCGYNFTVEHYWALSKACYNCPNISSDCIRLDCIPADGRPRGIIVINRQLPGPAIRVCQGDQVVVNLHNALIGEGTSIHWHGIHMKETPWYDGVPGVTQCMIQPGGMFRYEFTTPLPGTYFWHSHAELQRGDGAFGSLIVRQPLENEANSKLYNQDLPEHELLIWDWLGDLSLPVFLKHHHSNGDNKPRGILINGKGLTPKFYEKIAVNETIQSSNIGTVPIHEIRVKQDKKYRLRIISNGVLNCPLELSIEDHTMIVIASDGFDLQPVKVNSLVIYAGERWDVVLQANKPPGSYWIKIRGLMDCDNRFTSAYQVAVLNYDQLDPGTLPNTSIRTWYDAAATTKSHEIQLNPLNIAPGRGNRPYMSVDELNSAMDDDPEIILQEKSDYQFYISFDFNSIDNIRFHGPHIPIKKMKKEFKLYTPQLNYISNVMPSTPLLLTKSEDLINSCNETSLSQSGINCTLDYCECTHILKVPINSTVELVLVDRGYTFDANHPFHLHGHAFRIVAMERLSNYTEPWVVQELDERGLIERKRKNAPIKDSVTVPDGGFTIIRFRAINPGFWFFHCHITFHVQIGMGLIFQVGDLDEMTKPPEDFPRCGNYLPEIQSSVPISWAQPQETVIIDGDPHKGPPYQTLSSTTSHSIYDEGGNKTTTISSNFTGPATKLPLKTTKKPGKSSGFSIKADSKYILSHFHSFLLVLFTLVFNTK